MREREENEGTRKGVYVVPTLEIEIDCTLVSERNTSMLEGNKERDR